MISGYIRVSRVGGRDETDGFISPDVQEKAIREFAERRGLSVVVERPELNVSGGTMDRPIFNEIMEKIRSGASEGIVVYKTDRFARTALGALSTLAELGKHKASFASATEPELDYSTAAGKAFLGMLFVFNQFIRDSLTESWATTAEHAIARGIHISPVAYLGYDLGEDRRLVPNDLAPLVKEVFRRRGEGESWVSLADFLNETIPKPEGKMWTGQSVARICSKRVYLGEASRYVDQDKEGHGPIVNSDAHEPIVTQAEFDAAQVDPTIAWGGASDRDPWLLQGFVRCAGCRYSLSLGSGPRGEPLLRCRSRHASGKCPAPAMITRTVLEPYVEGLVLDRLEQRARFLEDSSDREQVRGELGTATREYDELRHDTESRRRLGHEDWLDMLSAFKATVDDLSSRLAEADRELGMVRAGLTRELYLDLPIVERRHVLAGFIDCVMVRKSRGRGRHVDPVETRTRILWRGEAPDDLPRKRRANRIVSFDFEDDIESRIAASEDGA